MKEILFGVTVTARVVRIWPMSKNHDFYALRFEIIGCVLITTECHVATVSTGTVQVIYRNKCFQSSSSCNKRNNKSMNYIQIV